MYEIIDEIQGNVLALRIAGEISDKERIRLTRLAEERIEKWGRLRLLIVTEAYPTFNSAEDLYEDLGFAVRLSGEIYKMAVVGDRAWKTTWVALFGLFAGIEARYFSKEEIQDAWRWITSG